MMTTRSILKSNKPSSESNKLEIISINPENELHPGLGLSEMK
jgi:hypothetical protein